MSGGGGNVRKYMDNLPDGKGLVTKNAMLLANITTVQPQLLPIDEMCSFMGEIRNVDKTKRNF